MFPKSWPESSSNGIVMCGPERVPYLSFQTTSVTHSALITTMVSESNVTKICIDLRTAVSTEKIRFLSCFESPCYFLSKIWLEPMIQKFGGGPAEVRFDKTRKDLVLSCAH